MRQWSQTSGQRHPCSAASAFGRVGSNVANKRICSWRRGTARRPGPAACPAGKSREVGARTSLRPPVAATNGHDGDLLVSVPMHETPYTSPTLSTKNLPHHIRVLRLAEEFASLAWYPAQHPRHQCSAANAALLHRRLHHRVKGDAPTRRPPQRDGRGRRRSRRGRRHGECMLEQSRHRWRRLQGFGHRIGDHCAIVLLRRRPNGPSFHINGRGAQPGLYYRLNSRTPRRRTPE